MAHIGQKLALGAVGRFGGFLGMQHLVFGALTFRDVARDTQQAHHTSSLADSLQADFDRRTRPSLAASSHSRLGWGSPAHTRWASSRDLLTPYRREQTGQRQASRLLARIPQNALPGLVQRSKGLFQIQGEDDVVGVFYQFLVALFQHGLALQDDDPGESAQDRQRQHTQHSQGLRYGPPGRLPHHRHIGGRLQKQVESLVVFIIILVGHADSGYPQDAVGRRIGQSGPRRPAVGLWPGIPPFPSSTPGSGGPPEPIFPNRRPSIETGRES